MSQVNSIVLTREAKSLVARANAGDENAAATIRETGKAARRGSLRAQMAAKVIEHFAKKSPSGASGGPVVGPNGWKLPRPIFSVVRPQSALATFGAEDPELRKPALPPGALSRIFDPNVFVAVVLRASQYRHGLGAAAVVLAAGPTLTGQSIRTIGASNFGSDEATATYLYGVKNHGEEAWAEVGRHLDPVGRKCLVVGQCVGRAVRIQALRGPDCPIGVYSPVVGWELGE